MKVPEVSKLSELNITGPCIIIMTKGLYFERQQNGSGSTGRWKASADQVPEEILIYFRPEDKQIATLFFGEVTEVEESDEPGRLTIHFDNSSVVGFTRSNWSKFAETGSNPVKYL